MRAIVYLSSGAADGAVARVAPGVTCSQAFEKDGGQGQNGTSLYMADFYEFSSTRRGPIPQFVPLRE